jgi:hypothetical protein
MQFESHLGHAFSPRLGAVLGPLSLCTVYTFVHTVLRNRSGPLRWSPIYMWLAIGVAGASFLLGRAMVSLSLLHGPDWPEQHD